MSTRDITTAPDALTYIFGGHAFLTLQSEKSGKHYTYRITRKANEDGTYTPFFVGVLASGDNVTGYDYIGFLPDASSDAVVGGRKGDASAPSAVALSWAIRNLRGADGIPAGLRVQHEGKCCRCGHKLTHPDSTIIGPECAKKAAA